MRCALLKTSAQEHSKYLNIQEDKVLQLKEKSCLSYYDSLFLSMEQKLWLILGAFCPLSILFLEFPQMRKGIFLYVSFLCSSQKDNRIEMEVSLLTRSLFACIVSNIRIIMWEVIRSNHKLCCWLLQSLLVSHLTCFWSCIKGHKK